MAEFAQINSDSKSSYPQEYKAPEGNQSVGFITPYKLQSGNTRGSQRIKGTIEVVDENNTVRLIMGYKKGAF